MLLAIKDVNPIQQSFHDTQPYKKVQISFTSDKIYLTCFTPYSLFFKKDKKQFFIDYHL